MGDDKVIEGRVISGVAQQVTREGGVVRITLSLVPGAQLPSGLVKLPEPVTVQAGEFVAVEIGRIPEPDAVPAGPPVHMPHEMTLATVHFPQLPA